MSLNNISVNNININKENVQPLSSIDKPKKLDASELNVIETAPQELKSVATLHCDVLNNRDDEESDSDDIGAKIPEWKVLKRRDDSLPLSKPESLAPGQKFYSDLNSIYSYGCEYSFEEIRYRKWLNWKKEKDSKRYNKEIAKEIVNLKRKMESYEQAVQLLQDKLSTVMGLIQVNKPVSEDKQEVSVMVRDLINGSYNDTQIEKTIVKPVLSIPVKDFTIYKDMTIETPTLVAPVQDNVSLIRFDITECGEVAKNPVSSSALSKSKELEKSIHSQTFNLKKSEIPQQSCQVQASNENLKEENDANLLIHMDSIEIEEPNCDFLQKLTSDTHDPIDMEIEKDEPIISQIKPAIEETKRKSLLGLRDNNKLSMIAENSRDSTTATTEKISPVKMRPPVAPCKLVRHDFDLADLSVNPIIHRGSMNFRVSEAFTMYIPNSEDECVPKSCSTPGKTQ